MTVRQNPPPLETVKWFNTGHELTLPDLRGKVVVLHAFQMLCPGCVSHGLPQAQRIHTMFSGGDVQVIGLHTVFEHHEVMTPDALEVFIHEYRWTFPVAVDKPGVNETMPATMKAYEMRGTPSLLMFDRQGRLRHHSFGRDDDLEIGANIMALICENQTHGSTDQGTGEPSGNDDKGVCKDDICEVN